jgi:hypothetical protein
MAERDQEDMSNEDFVDHLCAWDYTDGNGEIEDGDTMMEFSRTLTLTLQEIPKTSPFYARLAAKKLEVDNITRMKDDIVAQISALVEESDNAAK